MKLFAPYTILSSTLSFAVVCCCFQGVSSNVTTTDFFLSSSSKSNSSPTTDASAAFVIYNNDDQQQQRRRLIYQRIWNYLPKTKITDIAAIDLDMEVIWELLAENKFEEAKKVYKEGGHVGSTAILELVEPLDQDIPAGTGVVIPIGENDDTGFGTLYINAKKGEKLLLVTYGTTVNQDDYVGCQVGALPNPKTSGCFVESGSVNFPDLNKNYAYTYKRDEENINVRTLMTVGIDSQNYANSDTYNKYKEYYKNSALYSDVITTSALNGKSTGSGRGDMDFSIFGIDGKKEIAGMAMVLLTIWMAVVGNMEEAVNKCNVGVCETEICEVRPGVHEWDSAVAYYAGSLVDFASHKGNLLFYYADRRCEDMSTCGTTGTESQGNSFVNHEVFHWFIRGQRDIEERYCDGAKVAKNKIIELMTVPLVQGTIRYAHIVQGEMKEGVNHVEKHDAEAAGHALAVLPLVHHCNPDDAKIIYDNLKPKSPTSADFSMVKHALEKNYQCMNIHCHQIGGIKDGSTNSYVEGAEPCHDLTVGLSEEQRRLALVLGITFGTLFIIAIIVCVVGRTEKGAPEPKNDLELQANTDAEMT